MRLNLAAALPFILSLIGSISAKLIFVPFDDPRISYSSHWTQSERLEGSNSSTSGGTGSQFAGSTAQDACSKLDGGVGAAGAAASTAIGASFTFQFVGVSASILTTTGSEAPAYLVTRDNSSTIALISPGKLASSDCRVTYVTAPLPHDGTTHTLAVAIDASATEDTVMRVRGIVYDDGEIEKSPSDNKPVPTLLIGIAVASGLVLLFVLLAVIYCCRRDTRAPLYVEQEDGTSARRVIETKNAFGILSSTPTFLRNDDTKKYKTHIRLMSDELTVSETIKSQSKGSTGFSRFTLLKPPVPYQPRPGQGSYPDRLQVPTSHYQAHSRTQSTTAGTVLTSFSV